MLVSAVCVCTWTDQDRHNSARTALRSEGPTCAEERRSSQASSLQALSQQANPHKGAGRTKNGRKTQNGKRRQRWQGGRRVHLPRWHHKVIILFIMTPSAQKGGKKGSENTPTRSRKRPQRLVKDIPQGNPTGDLPEAGAEGESRAHADQKGSRNRPKRTKGRTRSPPKGRKGNAITVHHTIHTHHLPASSFSKP